MKSWAYPSETTRRDLRLDLLRGFAVFAMVVDHVGGSSWITPITGENQFLVSAAEAFVFLSGFVLGMVYGRRIERVGWTQTTEAILRRAALLYAVTVGLTLLFVGLFIFTDLRLWLDRQYGLGLTDPAELIVGTLTLHYTYHGTDILWMYTVMMAVTPILFHLLATGRTVPLLAGSVALWWVYQLFPARAAIPWVADNAVYFPVAAWQLYFVSGLVFGYQRDALAQRLGGLPRWPLLALFGLAFASLILLDWGRDTGRLAAWPLLKGLSGETYDLVFDKPSVAWGRVAAFAIAAGFFFLLVTQFWQPIYRLSGWLLIPLGQAALLSYGLHLVVIVAVYNLDRWGLYESSRWWNTLFQALTVAMVWGLVKVWDRLGALPATLTRLLDAPLRQPARRRVAVAVASALLVIITASTALLVGPVRASRQTTSVEEGLQAAGTLIHSPEAGSTDSPARVLLVLADTSTTGPMTAGPLIERARQTGWMVVAPTLDYGPWSTEEEVRAAVGDLLPGLAELVGGIDEHVGQPTQGKVYVFGRGRGGQVAQLFALFYPELVRGVATVNAVPCTLPLADSGQATEFPDGLGDVAAYRGGEPADLAALRDVSFWLVHQLSGEPTRQCDWLDRQVDPDEQLQLFARLLQQAGAEVQIVPPTDLPGRPGPAALQYLESLSTR
jgi:hypothetical protein